MSEHLEARSRGGTLEKILSATASGRRFTKSCGASKSASRACLWSLREGVEGASKSPEEEASSPSGLIFSDCLRFVCAAMDSASIPRLRLHTARNPRFSAIDSPSAAKLLFPLGPAPMPDA